MHSVDVIQVELVGQPWWVSALPVIAILVSFGSVGLTLWFRRRDDARIAVEASFGEWAQYNGVLVIATNTGRSGRTVIQYMGLRKASGYGLFMERESPGSDPLPKRLEPGDRAMLFVPAEDLLEACTDEEFKRLKFEVRYAHGKTVKRTGADLARQLADWRAMASRP